MAAADEIRVEVAYALPERQVLLPVRLPAGATVRDAVQASGIAGLFPGIEIGVTKVGIFGHLTDWDQPLRDGDRVELYRPLKADPKEIRRRLAAEGKTMGKPRGGAG